MSSDPRHIPAKVVQIMRAIARHTGLSESDVLCQALCPSMLIAEATRISSRHSGLQADSLAKALRRHLSRSASEGGRDE
jgi:hypothetical protein